MFRDARSVLRQYNQTPKRSFGQNFLIAQPIVEKIALQCVRAIPTTVIEIGAGLGTLTAALLEHGANVFAIERDRDLVPILNEELKPYLLNHQLSVIEDDAATCDWLGLWSQKNGAHVLAGNLPYQITGRLLERAVQHADQISHAVFMVQREVADRLLAQPSTKAYGQLSVFTQARFQIHRVCSVSASCFYPKPNVESVVLEFTPWQEPQACETPFFGRVVHAAFQSRRKTLLNALATTFLREHIHTAAKSLALDLNRRGETLSVKEFAALAHVLADLS